MKTLAQQWDDTIAAYEDQPEFPTDGKPCEWDDDRPTVGWAWTGRHWAAACPAHIQGDPHHQIFNSEYEED